LSISPGATGNVATEEVVYMLEGLGIEIGVDIAKLMISTNEISSLSAGPLAAWRRR
jgi:hydroxymethylglutaryl-CoA lyase